MKRKLFLLLCALLTMIGVQAQSWTPSEPAAGEFYLYNVGAEGFLVGANNWGTRASIDATGGIPVTLAGNGTYTISTAPTYSGKYLGSNGYVDGDSYAWTFETVAGQDKVYKLKAGDKYLFADAVADANLLAKTTTVGADPGTNMAYWMLISKSNLHAAMANATPASPVWASSLIKNPGFGRNINNGGNDNGKGWGWTISANNKNMSGGKNENRIAEHWQSAFTVKQTISDLPNGIYQLRIQAALTEYTVTGTDFPVVYLKSGANEGTQIFNKMANGENSMDQLSDRFANGEYFTEFAQVLVSNNTLEIGVRGTRTNTWCTYDNFQLRYLGVDLDELKATLASDRVAAKAILDASSVMNASVQSALQSAYDGTESVEESKSALEAAISLIETAINNANSSVETYAKALTILNAASSLDAAGQASYTANATIAALQNDYNNRTLVAISDDQKTACAEALKTAAKAQTTEGADMTLAIENWDFLNCANNNFPGWIIYAPNGGNTNTLGNTKVEYWIGTAANGAFDYYQTVTDLPAGKYTLSASMWNSTNGENPVPAGVNKTSGVYGTSGASTVFAGVANESTDANLVQATTDEITVTNGTLRLGVKNNGTMGARWFGVDWIKLTFVEAISLQDYYDQITALVGQAGAITGKQSVATADELSAAVTEGNALVSEASTDIEALNASIDRLTAAITASQTSVHSYAVIATGVVPDNSLVGWVCENTNTFHINTWSTEGNPGNDPSGMVTPFIENWVGKGSFLGAGRVYYQLQGLNPGEVYYAQALVRSYNEANADAPNGPNFFINDDVVDMTEAGTTFTYNNMSGIYATLRGAATVGDDGTLTLGVQIADDRNYNWVAFKSISIRSMKDALNAVIEETEATIPTGNIGTGVFQYVSAAVSARQAKIDAAKAVYDDPAATQEQMEEQIGILEAEKATAIPLNAPDPEKRYWLSIVDNGQTWDGFAVTFIAGGRSDMGNYAIKYLAPASVNMDQAVKFVAVPGEANTYKLSGVRAENGGEQYISTGAIYEGSNTQIRTTDDVEKALLIKIQATTTDGQFQLLNTADGNKVIARNATNPDNGMYTNGNNNFTIEEASKAEVKLQVSNGKLGTFVAPFDITLPEKVKAYSATATETKVTLTKIAEGGDELKAGTPVVVYGDGADVEETFNKYAIFSKTENPTVDDNALVGLLVDKNVPAGAYVLQTQTGNQGFYKVAGTEAVPGVFYRSYLIAASPNARLVISFDGEDPTAINAIEAAEAEDGALKDGKYLIDGKVILVKNGVKYSANGQILK